MIGSMMAQMLEGSGFLAPPIAQSYKQAMELARCYEPTLALVDYGLLDGRTGLDVARELRARHGTTCIMVSADLEPEPAKAAGAFALLRKPVRLTDVRQVLDRALAWIQQLDPAMVSQAERPFYSVVR